MFPNGIIVKVDGEINMFLLGEEGQISEESYVFTTEDGFYEKMTEDQISFVIYNDSTCSSSELARATITHDIKTSVTVKDAMIDGVFDTLVNHLLTDLFPETTIPEHRTLH